MIQFVKKNEDFEIMGENGWEDFSGLLITQDDNINIIRITTETDKWIECTENHKLFDRNNNIIYPINLKVNDEILTKDGLEKIKSLQKLKTNIVFDILKSDSHKILSNGILSHNCDEFAFVQRGQCIDETGLISIEDNDGIKRDITLKELYKIIKMENDLEENDKRKK